MFSEKYGYGQEKELMVENITEVLRNRIWNVFTHMRSRQVDYRLIGFTEH